VARTSCRFRTTFAIGTASRTPTSRTSSITSRARSSSGASSSPAARSGGKEITGAHQLVIVSGKRVEEVVIEELTPGVAVGVGPDSLAVSFEPGTFLTFTPEHGDRLAAQARGDFAEGPNPFPANDGDHRELANPFPGSLGGGNYTLATDARSVNYQGKTFDVVGESVEATLLIDARSLKQVSTTRQIAPGMRLR
jgi:hypothetical protein